jgi:hypothetical protein
MIEGDHELHKFYGACKSDMLQQITPRGLEASGPTEYMTPGRFLLVVKRWKQVWIDCNSRELSGGWVVDEAAQ